MTNLVEKRLIMIIVKLFAILKDKAGTGELTIPTSPATVPELLRQISKDYPALSDILSHRGILISVNQEFVKQDALVKDGDEVALMPPFSGGSGKGINPKPENSTVNIRNVWPFDIFDII